MLVEKLKSIFVKTSTDEFSAMAGEELANLLLDSYYQQIKSQFEQDISQELVCGLLFSYRLVVAINDIRMSPKILEGIFNSFTSLLIEQGINDSDLDQDKLVENLREQSKSLMASYQRKSYNKRIKKVKEIAEELINDLDYLDHDFDVAKDLIVDFIFKNVTLIQDFLTKKERIYVRGEF